MTNIDLASKDTATVLHLKLLLCLSGLGWKSDVLVINNKHLCPVLVEKGKMSHCIQICSE